MNGKASMQKSMRRLRSNQSKSGNPRIGSYIQIGNWRFEENEEGDLVIMNLETSQIDVWVRREDEG